MTLDESKILATQRLDHLCGPHNPLDEADGHTRQAWYLRQAQAYTFALRRGLLACRATGFTVTDDDDEAEQSRLKRGRCRTEHPALVVARSENEVMDRSTLCNAMTQSHACGFERRLSLCNPTDQLREPAGMIEHP